MNELVEQFNIQRLCTPSLSSCASALMLASARGEPRIFGYLPLAPLSTHITRLIAVLLSLSAVLSEQHT